MNLNIGNIYEDIAEIFESTTNAHDLELARDTLVQNIICMSDMVGSSYNFSDYETPVYFPTTDINERENRI